MTREHVLLIIRAKVKNCEGQTRAADAYGVSPSHLNDVLQGNRKPGPKLLKGMGLESVESYRKIGVEA